MYIKVPMTRSGITMSIVLSIIASPQWFGEPFLMADLTVVSTACTPNRYIGNMAFSYGSMSCCAVLPTMLAAIVIPNSGAFRRLPECAVERLCHVAQCSFRFAAHWPGIQQGVGDCAPLGARAATFR